VTVSISSSYDSELTYLQTLAVDIKNAIMNYTLNVTEWNNWSNIHKKLSQFSRYHSTLESVSGSWLVEWKSGGGVRVWWGVDNAKVSRDKASASAAGMLGRRRASI